MTMLLRAIEPFKFIVEVKYIIRCSIVVSVGFRTIEQSSKGCEKLIIKDDVIKMHNINLQGTQLQSRMWKNVKVKQISMVSTVHITTNKKYRELIAQLCILISK